MTARAGISIALFAALCAMRARYWGQVPVGEENFFSQLGLWGYHGVGYHGQLPSGLVGGVPFAADAEHPSAPYWWFHAVGVLLRAGPSLSTAGVIEALRVVMSLVFAAVIALGFHLCAPRELRVRAALAVACFALFSTPFWVGASLQLQQDGVLGTVPYVLLFAAAIARARAPASRALIALAGAGGFLVAFDKPERALLFIAAGVAGAVIARARRSWRAMLPEAAGFALGLAVILIADGAHWLESFDVAHRIAAAEAQASPSAYLAFVGRFIPLALVALAIVAAAIARPPVEHRSIQLAAFVALTVASALRLRWLGDSFPRYFAPPLALVQLWLIAQAGALWSSSAAGWRRIGRALLVPLFGLAIWQTWMHFPAPGVRSITSMQGARLSPIAPDRARTDCVSRVDLDAINRQSGSWALDTMHGVTPDDHGLGGLPYCP